MLKKIREFIKQSRYVLKLARKPTKEEFKRTAKITGAGIVLLGGIWYIFQFAYTWLLGLFGGGNV